MDGSTLVATDSLQHRILKLPIVPNNAFYVREPPTISCVEALRESFKQENLQNHLPDYYSIPGNNPQARVMIQLGNSGLAGVTNNKLIHFRAL